jgi:hypothetical protein
MSRQPEKRALPYHNYAAFLRRLANQPRPKRHVPDCVRWPISSNSLRKAFTALGLLPDRPLQPLTTRNDNVHWPEAPPRLRGAGPFLSIRWTMVDQRNASAIIAEINANTASQESTAIAKSSRRVGTVR